MDRRNSNNSSEVEAFLYDASGHDEKIDPNRIGTADLAENHLLWVNISKRDEKLLESVVSALELKGVPLEEIVAECSRPVINRFDTFFRFCIHAIITKEGKSPEKQAVDFIVGKNFVLTMHEGPVDYFAAFRERERGETQFGELDAESFVATLLDLNIITYFHALDELEKAVDEMDDKVLQKDFEAEDFLKQMVRLRRDASRLRRWLVPHREVFYSLSRSDFRQIAESDSHEEYKMLNLHFESAVDAIEHSRETVLSVFDLYASKSAQQTNQFIRRLTFLTLMTGSLAVIAGILGMNYKADIFEAENGFWLTVGTMILIALGLSVFARFKRWI
ncbi:MAG: magnesium transporter CorA family protein [Saprospiraceae bacterium]|nr:magnesium transporter CorA family protein [Pyrinomonadaceae bacterium]